MRDDVASPPSRLREQSRAFAGSSLPVVSAAPPPPSNSSDTSTIRTIISTSSATLTDSDDYEDDGTWQKPPTEIVDQGRPPITIKHDDMVPISTTFRWVRGEIIGEGPYGRTYLALNATTGELMVVKQMEIHRPQIRKRTEATKAFRFESTTLKDLDHPNIIQYLGFEESTTDLSIFLEYFPSDSVGSVLLEHGKLSESVIASFAAQILSGLGYLHLKGILHGNLMPENILVDMSGVCKISGWSTRTSRCPARSNGANVPITPVEDSVFWMAPEMLEPPEKGYDFKVDIWSLGCVVLEMLTGTRPWSSSGTLVVFGKVSRERTPPPLPEGVVLSELADDFLRRKCFAGNPNERPTASELMEHEYLELPPGWQFSGFP
ncbi:mitogen-activated protein kinase kinase kinase [Marasmius tenuissimus]|nr:mitogen-activated protein kinase kinase kinase [Marasmius tenuissimus]